MIKIIIYFLITAFLVVGLSDFLYHIWQFLITPSPRPKTEMKLYLDGSNDYAALYWFTQKIKWYGPSFCDKAVVVKYSVENNDIYKCFENKNIIFLENENSENNGEVYDGATTEGNS